jgi:septal ring factor EnvC (AmiA/AmiB activator)
MKPLNIIDLRAAALRLAALCTGVLLALGLAATPSLAQRADRSQTEAELGRIRSEIDRIRAQVSRDAAERDRLTRELRSAEQAVAGARERLRELQRQRNESRARRNEIEAQGRARERELASERNALAGQLRAAYMIGREEPLKLLLNQRDPARAGRMFAYYGYFGRARAGQIARIREHIATLAELQAQLDAEERRYAALEQEQKEELQVLEAARSERSAVLAKVEQESRSRVASLARLRKEQAALERLLRELQRAVERFPSDSREPFAKLRGKLAWPVAGRVAARYGETRAGGLKWEGMLLTAERGAVVRSIYHGRVIYADWLAGLGLLVIVDHGGGYMSLYGHNDALFRRVGERVTAGDSIAAVGDSGGRPRPELYFEIRRNAQPLDPRPWFQKPAPDG